MDGTQSLPPTLYHTRASASALSLLGAVCLSLDCQLDPLSHQLSDGLKKYSDFFHLFDFIFRVGTLFLTFYILNRSKGLRIFNL